MRRREFITLLGGAAAWPLAGFAQEAGKVRRIGFLRVGEPPAAFIDGFRRGLREVGLVEDRDFVIEFALPENTAQVPDAAAELVRRRVDILVASGTPSVLPARDAAGQIPVVFVATFDPVATELVASLARPGGNITGMTSISGDVIAKRLQLVTELIPNPARIAILVRGIQPYRSPIRAGIPGGGTEYGHSAEDRKRARCERSRCDVPRRERSERAAGSR